MRIEEDVCQVLAFIAGSKIVLLHSFTHSFHGIHNSKSQSSLVAIASARLCGVSSCLWSMCLMMFGMLVLEVLSRSSSHLQAFLVSQIATHFLFRLSCVNLTSYGQGNYGQGN